PARLLSKAARLRRRVIPAALRAAHITQARGCHIIIYSRLSPLIRHSSVCLFWYLFIVFKIINIKPGDFPDGNRGC
ncbi:hypothetical protein, partial [Citrobacter freundii]|uniref:hypothetical protein n=1 Tax=Citrobacter freundii TaxID=546 RepID=UPI001F14AABA